MWGKFGNSGSAGLFGMFCSCFCFLGEGGRAGRVFFPPSDYASGVGGESICELFWGLYGELRAGGENPGMWLVQVFFPRFENVFSPVRKSIVVFL